MCCRAPAPCCPLCNPQGHLLTIAAAATTSPPSLPTGAAGPPVAGAAGADQRPIPLASSALHWPAHHRRVPADGGAWSANRWGSRNSFMCVPACGSQPARRRVALRQWDLSSCGHLQPAPAQPQSCSPLHALISPSNPPATSHIALPFMSLPSYRARLCPCCHGVFLPAVPQVIALRNVSSTEAAIVYALEPVLGAFFAYMLLGER